VRWHTEFSVSNLEDTGDSKNCEGTLRGAVLRKNLISAALRPFAAVRS
jgi:hypothetical protein